MKNESSSSKKSHIRKIIDNISANKIASNAFFIFLLIFYLFSAFATNYVSKSTEMINLLGRNLPVSSFAGVISSIANMTLICLVVFYRKKGFYTCVIIYCIHFIRLFTNIFFLHSLPSIPGLFTSLVIIIALLIIFQRNGQIEKYQVKLQDLALTDQLTELANKLAYTEYVNALIKKGERFTIVSIDLNNFKSVN